MGAYHFVGTANYGSIIHDSTFIDSILFTLKYTAIVTGPILVVGYALAVFVRILDPFVVQALRLIAFDSYQRLAPEKYDPELPVRIVDVDQDSLAKLGQWPWPRTLMRDLVVKPDNADQPGAIRLLQLFTYNYRRRWPDRSPSCGRKSHCGSPRWPGPSPALASASPTRRYP